MGGCDRAGGRRAAMFALIAQLIGFRASFFSEGLARAYYEKPKKALKKKATVGACGVRIGDHWQFCHGKAWWQHHWQAGMLKMGHADEDGPFTGSVSAVSKYGIQ